MPVLPSYLRSHTKTSRCNHFDRIPARSPASPPLPYFAPLRKESHDRSRVERPQTFDPPPHPVKQSVKTLNFSTPADAARCELPAPKTPREDPQPNQPPAASPPCPGRFLTQNHLLPAPYARAGCRAFSSYPYRFVPGQPGQPGQTPETLTNRAFCKFNLNIYAGTQPGHAGTLQNQDVSGRAKCHIDGRAPLSRVVRFRGFSGRLQARPSVPPCPLVGVARQGLEALAAAQPVRGGRIGPAGDQLTAGGRQASAIARQVAALGTAPPVVPGALGVVNVRQRGRRVCFLVRRCLSRLDMRRGLHVATG